MLEEITGFRERDDGSAGDECRCHLSPTGIDSSSLLERSQIRGYRVGTVVASSTKHALDIYRALSSAFPSFVDFHRNLLTTHTMCFPR